MRWELSLRDWFEIPSSRIHQSLLVRSALKLGLMNGNDEQSAARMARWVTRNLSQGRDETRKARPIGFVDIGANEGLWLRHFLKLANNKSSTFDLVIAVEPNTTLSSPLHANLLGHNIKIEHEVLTDDEKPIQFLTNEINSRLSRVSSGELGEVRTGVQLSKLLSKYPRDLEWILKIDVEGHEENVLRGLGNRIEDCLAVYFEVGDNSAIAPYQKFGIYEYLWNQGFKLYTLGNDGSPALPISPGSLASLTAWTHDVLAVSAKLCSDQANSKPE